MACVVHDKYTDEVSNLAATLMPTHSHAHTPYRTTPMCHTATAASLMTTARACYAQPPSSLLHPHRLA